MDRERESPVRRGAGVRRGGPPSGETEGHGPRGAEQGVLDEHQAAAVGHGDGPALVLAGPGSGKTRVIVERAVRLIDEERARPEELLVLTFSRKAAADLRERLASRLQRSYASFPITTFHAFCLAILSREAPEPPRP